MEANVVVDASSRKSEGSLAILITRQPRLLKNLKGMQIEIRVKKVRNVPSQLNQVSIQYDLYERIK